MLSTLCVASCLSLFALAGSDPTGGFHLGTLSIAGPSLIMGPILDMVAISRDVEGTSCEEMGWHINSCLLHLFTTPARALRFASSVVTLWGYKYGSHPCVQPPSSCMISHRLPASFSTTEKKER
jgi:hypothetical protein